jgi:hypothetical protein
MPQFNTPYSPLIETCDAIGWIPTIRGNLSLNVFDDSNSLLGDVDKFAVEVKTYDRFSTSRYLVASSLYTNNDNKRGCNYKKTFRFIFRGSINDQTKTDTFSKQFNRQERNVSNLINNKGLLIGKLSIIATLTDNLTAQEAYLLKLLTDLKGMKKRYINAYDVEAKSCEELAAMRTDLKTEWEKVEAQIIEIENINNGNPIYKFDVILSRDGILFLKNDTCPKFLRDFYVENTHSDYKQNIPIHRIFKTAMIFIKFLFHMNYHHREEHDTSLPVTNLHPIETNSDLDKIIKHQTDTLLAQITKIKRYSKKYVLCNPDGILLYAESFLHVFEKNMIFNDIKSLDFHYKFIEKQRKEFDVFSSENKTVFNFFLSQKNILATFTIALSILLAVIKTLDFFKFNEALQDLTATEIFNYRVLIVSVCLILAYLFHRSLVDWYIFRGKFCRKKKAKNILNRNSNIGKKRFSILYNIRLRSLNVTHAVMKNFFGIAGFLIIIVAVICVLLYCWKKSIEF